MKRIVPPTRQLTAGLPPSSEGGPESDFALAAKIDRVRT